MTEKKEQSELQLCPFIIINLLIKTYYLMKKVKFIHMFIFRQFLNSRFLQNLPFIIAVNHCFSNNS